MGAGRSAAVRLLVTCVLGACFVGGAGRVAAWRELVRWPRWTRDLTCLWGVFAGACMSVVATSWLEAAELIACAAVLLACSVTDLARRIIPNSLVAVAIAIRGAYLCLEAAWPGDGIMGSRCALEETGESLLGGAVVLLVLIAAGLFWARTRGGPQWGIGGGDAKLLSACGAYLGPIGGMTCVALSCLLAIACCAGAWAVSRGRGEKERFPREFPLAPQALVSMVILTAYRAF